jgi:hypothetical protein
MKTCKSESCTYPVWGKGYCKSHQRLRTDRKASEVKPRKPIRPMSKKLSKERVTYRQLREEFLSKPENMFCAVYPYLRATQIHHPFGRLGEHLNATHEWIAVSHEGHTWIHENVSLAMEKGFLKSRLALVTPLNH